MKANTFVTIRFILRRFILREDHWKINYISNRRQPVGDNITYQLPNRLKKKIEATEYRMKSSASDFLFSYPIFRTFIEEPRNRVYFPFCEQTNEPITILFFSSNGRAMKYIRLDFITSIVSFVSFRSTISTITFTDYFIIEKLRNCVMLLLNVDKIFSIFGVHDLALTKKFPASRDIPFH